MKYFAGRTAVLTTQHGKEDAIQAVVEEELGLHVVVCRDIDTDRFGTFTRDIPRRASQRETAIAKARAGMAARSCDLGIASEGSFGPHPQLPFAVLNTELVMLVDDRLGQVLEGWASTMQTHSGSETVPDVDAALQFARRVGFPECGLVVRRAEDDTRGMVKGIRSQTELITAVERLLRHGPAFIEVDLRAHMNPRRMANIRQAAADLARNARRTCPACQRPGFRLTDTRPGLPCAWCGEPTRLPLAEIYTCGVCGEQRKKPIVQESAEPRYCPRCNP